MKGLSFGIVLLMLKTLAPQLSAQSIVLKAPDLALSSIEFAGCYGENIFVVKQIKINENGFGLIHNDTLASGIYFLYLNDSVLYEFLYDSDFPGKITLSRKDKTHNFAIEGPEVVCCYHSYQQTMDSLKAVDLKKSALKNDKTKKNLKSSLDQKTQSFNYDSLLEETISKCPGDFLKVYLKATQKPTIPDFKSSGSSPLPDSAALKFQLEYFRKHFLDNVDISDFRLLHTPIYVQKVSEYLDQMVSHEPEKLCRAVDYLVEKTKNDPVCKPFLIKHLFEKYHSLKQNAIDEYVYLYIIESYYLRSAEGHLSNYDLELLNDEYNQLKPLSLLQPAPDFVLNNSYGLPVKLYETAGDIIVLYFYNYDCPHCQHITPNLVKLSNRYNYLDIDFLAICIGDSLQLWQDYIKTKGMLTFTNLFEPATAPETATKFNLSHIPVLFILNKKHEIEKKHITIPQLEKYLFEYATKK